MPFTECEGLVNVLVRSGVTRVKTTGSVDTERGEEGRLTPGAWLAGGPNPVRPRGEQSRQASQRCLCGVRWVHRFMHK